MIKKVLILYISITFIILLTSCTNGNEYNIKDTAKYENESNSNLNQENIKKSEEKVDEIKSEEKNVIEKKEKNVTEEKEITKEEEINAVKEKILVEEVKEYYSNMPREKIKLIQKGLIKEGYNPGVIDGYIGKNTISAVLEYQYDNHKGLNGVLKEVDVENLGVIEIMEVSITLNSLYMEYNYSVGNEWGYGFSVNGVEFNRGSTHKFTVDPDESLVIEAAMTEYDKISDNGYNRVYYTSEELKNKNDFSDLIEVRVKENRGRYSGNSALWKFKYSIKTKYKFKLN